MPKRKNKTKKKKKIDDGFEIYQKMKKVYGELINLEKERL